MKKLLPLAMMVLACAGAEDDEGQAQNDTAFEANPLCYSFCGETLEFNDCSTSNLDPCLRECTDQYEEAEQCEPGSTFGISFYCDSGVGSVFAGPC
jgi:hypothetical protein